MAKMSINLGFMPWFISLCIKLIFWIRTAVAFGSWLRIWFRVEGLEFRIRSAVSENIKVLWSRPFRTGCSLRGPSSIETPTPPCPTRLISTLNLQCDTWQLNPERKKVWNSTIRIGFWWLFWYTYLYRGSRGMDMYNSSDFNMPQ